MREIKFRAWDKKNNKMIYFSDFGIAKEAGFGYSNPQIILTSKAKHDHNWELDMADIELMQFTGLKDKNGKEIYESDIVCITPTAGLEESYTAEVIWDEERAGFRVDCGYDFMDFYILNETECNIEAIGNMYENPELLEVT